MVYYQKVNFYHLVLIAWLYGQK